MENHPLSSINGSSQAPYMNSLAHTYGLATNYSAITHPSEPNYMALVGGNTFVSGDGNCCFGVDAPNIIDRLEAALLTWKAFAEDATGSGTCAFKPPREADHFPFLEFHNMNTSTRCTNMLTTESRNDPEFLAELNSSNPANLIWLTPNDEDNMHSSSISTGDSYLSALVPSVLSSKLFAERRAALFITFDEGIRTDQTVYAVWAGPVAKRGFRSSSHFSHYSLLKTLETSWGLESLTSNDANATPMEGFLTSITPPEPPSAAGNPPIIWLAVLGLALVLVTAAVILKVRSRSRKT